MRAIAVISLVPVLGDVDPGKLQRRLDRHQSQRIGDAIGEILRQRHDALGLRRHDGACDRMLARALPLGRQALEKQEGEERVYVDGTAQLFDKPEFSNLKSLRSVLRAFDEKARLLDLVTRYLNSKGPCVVLGSETGLGEESRLSAVLTSYGTGETLTGMLGVLGPARREYPRVIPVVELLGRALSDRLEGREAPAEDDPE